MKAKEIKDDFDKQLVATNNEINNLQNQIKNLEIKREQLKGAVYALGTLIQAEAAAVSATEDSDLKKKS